jgi:hypothetical protein
VLFLYREEYGSNPIEVAAQSGVSCRSNNRAIRQNLAAGSTARNFSLDHKAKIFVAAADSGEYNTTLTLITDVQLESCATSRS